MRKLWERHQRQYRKLGSHSAFLLFRFLNLILSCPIKLSYLYTCAESISAAGIILSWFAMICSSSCPVHYVGGWSSFVTGKADASPIFDRHALVQLGKVLSVSLRITKESENTLFLYSDASRSGIGTKCLPSGSLKDLPFNRSVYCKGLESFDMTWGQSPTDRVYTLSFCDCRRRVFSSALQKLLSKKRSPPRRKTCKLHSSRSSTMTWRKS